MKKFLITFFLIITGFIAFFSLGINSAEALVCSSGLHPDTGQYCEPNDGKSWCGNGGLTCRVEQTYGQYTTTATGATFIASDCGVCTPTCKNGQIACKNNSTANPWDSAAACQDSQYGDICDYTTNDTNDTNDGIYTACGACTSCNTTAYNDCRNVFGTNRGCVSDGELTTCLATDPNCTDGSCNVGFTLDGTCGVCTAVSVTPVYLDYHTVPQTGDVSINGQIGIGLTDPGYQLHVTDNSGVAIINIDDGSSVGNRIWTGSRLERYDVEKWFIGMTDTDDNLTIRASGTSNILTINNLTGDISASGDIAVGGNMTIAGELTVGGESIIGGGLWTSAVNYIHSGGESIAIGTAASPVDFAGSSGNLIYGNVNNAGGSSNLILLQYNSSDRFVVDTFGNTYNYGSLSVHTSNTGYPLYVADDDVTAIINIDNIGDDLWTGTRLARDGSEKWFIGMSDSSDNLVIRANNSDNILTINSSTGEVTLANDLTVNGDTTLNNLNITGGLTIDGQSLRPTEIKETSVVSNANFGGWASLKLFANNNGCAAADGWHVCQSWELTYLYSEGVSTSQCDTAIYDSVDSCLGWIMASVSETVVLNNIAGDCDGYTSSDSSLYHSSIWYVNQFGIAQCSDALPVLCCK